MNDSSRVRVWDLPVRLFHWSLVAVFAGAWATSEDFDSLHHFLGYTALGLVAFRILWGFVGSRHARFSDFVPGPAGLKAYLGQMLARREPRYLGHNPAGAAMILFLLTMVLGIGGTGWLMTTDWGWGSDTLEELHEGLVNFTTAAVAVHVLGAIYASLRHRENLIRSMLSGYKRAYDPTRDTH